MPFEIIEKVRIAIVPTATDVDLEILLIMPPVLHCIIYHRCYLSFPSAMVNLMMSIQIRRLVLLVASCILFTVGCTRLIPTKPGHKVLLLHPGDNSFIVSRGVTVFFYGVSEKETIVYEVQSVSERTIQVVFHESSGSIPGPVFELSHDEFDLDDDQILMIQPLLSATSFAPAGEEFQVQCSIDSFSTFVRFTKLPYCLLISKADALYTAQHLPGKYLLEGDLLYHIGPNWIPSHSAVYLGVDYATAMTDEGLGLNDGKTFGESYPFLTHGYNLVEEGVFVFPNDIENHSFVNLFNYDTYESRWLKYWSSGFTGAMRYSGDITPLERRQISRYIFEAANHGAMWSVGLAWSGYLNLPFTKQDIYSCVGLVEKAYESAGRNIVPLWEDLFYLNSFEQFSRTIPVPEITSPVGELIEFRVNALIAEWRFVGYDKWSFSDHAWIWRSTNGVELQSEAGTLLDKHDHCIFRWTPQEVGDYEIPFRFFGEFGEKTIEKVHTLTIHVVGE